MSTRPRTHDEDFRLDKESIRVAATAIGPVRVGDELVSMRPPRLTDGPAWREACLREEERLKDSFGLPGVPWDKAVTLTNWVDRVGHQREAARAGLLMPYVVLYGDGRITGEISFAIDPRTGTAEISLWIAQDTPKVVRSWMVGMCMLRVFGLPTPIERAIAPVAVGNPGPTRLFELLGFRRHSTARELRSYGGVLTDHDIWWLDRSDDLLADFGRVLASMSAKR